MSELSVFIGDNQPREHALQRLPGSGGQEGVTLRLQPVPGGGYVLHPRAPRGEARERRAEQLGKGILHERQRPEEELSQTRQGEEALLADVRPIATAPIIREQPIPMHGSRVRQIIESEFGNRFHLGK